MQFILTKIVPLIQNMKHVIVPFIGLILGYFTKGIGEFLANKTQSYFNTISSDQKKTLYSPSDRVIHSGLIVFFLGLISFTLSIALNIYQRILKLHGKMVESRHPHVAKTMTTAAQKYYEEKRSDNAIVAYMVQDRAERTPEGDLKNPNQFSRWCKEIKFHLLQYRLVSFSVAVLNSVLFLSIPQLISFFWYRDSQEKMGEILANSFNSSAPFITEMSYVGDVSAKLTTAYQDSLSHGEYCKALASPQPTKKQKQTKQ